MEAHGEGVVDVDLHWVVRVIEIGEAGVNMIYGRRISFAFVSDCSSSLGLGDVVNPLPVASFVDQECGVIHRQAMRMEWNRVFQLHSHAGTHRQHSPNAVL
jgi:hypothetical protein